MPEKSPDILDEIWCILNYRKAIEKLYFSQKKID